MYRFERFSLSTSQHKETFPFDMFFWFAQWSVCILKQNKRTGSIFVQYQQCCKWYDFTHKKIIFLYHPERIIRHHMIHQVAEKMLMILLNYVCISSLLLGHTLVPSSLGNQFLSNRRGKPISNYIREMFVSSKLQQCKSNMASSPKTLLISGLYLPPGMLMPN